MQPVFYEAKDWKLTETHLEYSNVDDEAPLTYGDCWDGSMRMKIGEWEHHSIFINPEITIYAQDEIDDNGYVFNTIESTVVPFGDGAYIFDLELMPKYKQFEIEIERMWAQNESICDAQWGIITHYFQEHDQEMLDIFLEDVKKNQPDVYEKYIRLSHEYLAADRQPIIGA